MVYFFAERILNAIYFKFVGKKTFSTTILFSFRIHLSSRIIKVMREYTLVLQQSILCLGLLIETKECPIAQWLTHYAVVEKSRVQVSSQSINSMTNSFTICHKYNHATFSVIFPGCKVGGLQEVRTLQIKQIISCFPSSMI